MTNHCVLTVDFVNTNISEMVAEQLHLMLLQSFSLDVYTVAWNDIKHT